MFSYLYISNLKGTKPEVIRQKAEDIAGCQLNSPRFFKFEEELRDALSPMYNELYRRMGQRKGGVKFLVDLRADLIMCIKSLNETEMSREEKERLIPLLKRMNNHLKLLLAHWFSVGFLRLENITWNSSCSMLQKVSDYEAGKCYSGVPNVITITVSPQVNGNPTYHDLGLLDNDPLPPPPKG